MDHKELIALSKQVENCEPGRLSSIISQIPKEAWADKSANNPVIKNIIIVEYQTCLTNPEDAKQAESMLISLGVPIETIAKHHDDYQRNSDAQSALDDFEEEKDEHGFHKLRKHKAEKKKPRKKPGLFKLAK